MWLKNGGLLAASLAVIAIGVVSLGAWFALTHGADYSKMLEKHSETGVGVITVVVVLAAGALLAFAFNRAEQAFALFKAASSDAAEDREQRD